MTAFASIIFLREEFALEEGGALVQPVLVLHIDDVQFLKADVVRDKPGIEQTFADKAKDAAVIDRVAGHVQLFFQFKQDIKQPGAVVLQKLLFHDEHIDLNIRYR